MSHAAKRGLVWGFTLVMILGALLLLRIPFYYWRSWYQGQSLLHRALHARQNVPWTKSVLGVLDIPQLDLRAPIQQGTSMAVLSHAVGHLTASVMPGQPGTSVLAGHDITWFHNLDQIAVGSSIIIDRSGRQYRFKVERTAVVRAGTPIFNTATPGLVLVTCYPLNALYLTPYRYVVWATMTTLPSTTNRTVLRPAVPITLPEIPDGVKAQGLDLASNPMPMGVLTYSGHPSRQWVESNRPLTAANAITTLYFAAIHIARDHQPKWWRRVFPRVPYGTLSPLAKGTPVYVSPTSIQETV